MSTKNKSAKRKRVPLPPLDLAQRYEIDESCAYLRISRDFLYRKIRAGEIAVIRDGGRTYVPGSEIARASSLAVG